MKRATTILATVATTVAATLTAQAAPAEAAVASASVVGSTATVNLDGADDKLTVSVAGGLLVHGETTGGLSSGTDWDSHLQGDQTLPADGTFTLVINGGDGNDTIKVLAKNSAIINVTLDGGAGDDLLIGADSGDSLNGADGNDRLVGAKGGDDMNGGAGDDTLVWNNGDSSDFIQGDAGTDTTEVNGDPTLGDVFTLEPNTGRIKFRRTNLVSFTLIASTERFQVNGLGGDDSVAASGGVGALTRLSVDGGAGNDRVGGSDGPDLIRGGEGSDALSGGAGDDTFVWNDGDGSDVVNGDDGTDDVEVNGAPAAGDIFSVLQADGQAIRFERSDLVPFAIDINSSETLHVNGLGGDDAITVDGKVSVTAAGGSGDDTLTGGDASETFLGGPGNDTIEPGSGPDFVSGDDGDDKVDVRDNTSDVAFGGAGTLKVKLAQRSQRLADGNGRLRILAIASTGPPGQIAQSSRRLTLALGTARIQGRSASGRIHPRRTR